MIEPKLRFKKDDGSDFPDWEEKKLGDVCDTLTYGMNAAAVKFDGENKYIRITDIDDESHCYKNDELVSPDGELDNKYLVCENDILLARTGASVGKSYLYNKEDGKLYYAGFLIKAHVKSENSKFIFFQTLTERYDKWVKITSMRSGQPGINANEYSDFTMNVPSLPEQQKIADFLSTIDTIIEKQRATVSAWEERKKGVMQKLFSQEVRFKEDDGSDFPDWEEKTIGELGTFTKGAALSKADISDEGNPLILYGELYTTYKEVAYEVKRKTQAIVDKIYYSNVGDVLIPTSGESAEEISTATCVMVPNVILAGDLNIFRSTVIDGRIMSYILNYQAKWKIATIAQGKSIVHIQAKQLGKIFVEYPVDKDEQQKIADFLSALDTVIQKQKETLEKWQELKKGLLQQMFV